MFQHSNRKTCQSIHNIIFKVGYCQVVPQKIPEKRGWKKNEHQKRTRQNIHKQHEVVKYVTENFQQTSTIDDNRELGVLETKKHNLLHSLQRNPSQIFGFDINELSKRVDLFRAAGITFNDSISLSLVIPPFLHINNNNCKNVIKSIQKYGLPIEKLLYKFPYILGFEHIQVEENLKLLHGVSLKGDLEELILQQPIMLSCPLDKTSLSILERLGKVNSSKYIDISLHELAVKNKAISNFLLGGGDGMLSKDAKDFFIDFNIDLERIYRICPEILMSTKETLNKSLECVMSAPFYFIDSDVEKLLMTYPGVFISFHRENIAVQVQYLENIITPKRYLYQLLSEFAYLFRDPEKFSERVSLFKRFGFNDVDIKTLLVRRTSCRLFIDCDEYTDETLTKLLRFYLEERDLKPSQIIYSSPDCFKVEALPILKQRLTFLQHIGKVKEIPMKDKGKSGLTLRRIITSDINEFLELCASTMEEFDKFS